MIVWPIFVALFLAIIAVYFSIKAEDNKAKKERRLKEDEELKQLDLLKRKERLENENK